MPDDAIFALDIGTRTIIGLVGVQKEDHFLVQAVEIAAHESRAMLDGQIHDIAKVAEGVIKVKGSLEKKLGYKLTKVSIAAAGRVLKTCQVKADREIDENLEIDGQLVSALEMEAVQKARLKIESDISRNESDQYYCVGYSIVNYYLNDYIITSLMGHKGTRVGVEVLATFLPHMVVDSLYTVMERTGLEVTHLTLEPIAALNLAIPKELRLLNLALVDIGAGTSDIAITKSGTVMAYAMVPFAGDELTEAIAQNYLVDFNTAEKIKIEASALKEKITFTDILDNKIYISSKEVNDCIHPSVEQLAGTIAKKILEYNGGKAPNAIFLVGGGSQTDGLCEILSAAIGLPKERVAVRNRSMAKNIILEEDTLNGPDSITPLGILVTTAITSGQDFYYVTVNGNKVRMYNSRRMTVSDALILAGFNAEQLICKSGKSLKYVLNGRDKTIRGSMGKPAEIYLNNNNSNLNAFIVPGDELTVVPAENGCDAVLQASDLIKDSLPVYLEFAGHMETVFPRIIINGAGAAPEATVRSGDTIEIAEEISLEEIAKLFEMDFLVWDFKVNGKDCREKTVVKMGDHVLGIPRSFIEKPEEAIEKSGDALPETVPVDIQAASAVDDIESLLQNTAKLPGECEGFTVTVNGRAVGLPPKNTDYIFIDIFNFIDFDLTSPKGRIMLRLNGQEANYTDVIKGRDIIDIYWEKPKV
jgi:cell division protein FtsA